MDQQVTDPYFRVKIYPAGLKVERTGKYSPNPPEDSGRGDILAFSHAAARRLREWFMTKHVPNWNLFAVTLTTHHIFSPNEWRSACKRFRQSLIRENFAGVWRVELQRRQAPHLHVAFWLPPSATVEAVSALWLRATGEEGDPSAIAHAVMSKKIEADESGWAVYMGLHGGKHKREQLGWLGKQWGIWNRERFTDRTPEVFEMAPREHSAFLRFLRRLELANRRTSISKAKEILKAPASVQAVARAVKTLRTLKGRRLRLHEGNLLRLMKGETAARILHAMKSGLISHVSKIQLPA